MPSLYILKAICAIMIVFIHLPGVCHEDVTLQPLMRIGVPSFLLISGFFIVSDSKIDSDKVGLQLKKILKLTLWVYFVYMSFALLRNFTLGKPIVPETWLSISFLFRMFVVGDNIDSVLWYLTAYIEALLVLKLLLGTMKYRSVEKVLSIISPLLLIIAVMLNRYSDIWGRTFDIAVSRNALTVALPCIYIGAFARIHLRELEHRRKILTSITCVLVLLAYAEYYILHIVDINGSGADFNLLTFPLAISIFAFCLVNVEMSFLPQELKGPLVLLGKNYSSDIYLWHSLTWLIITLLVFLGSESLGWVANGESVILIILVVSTLRKQIKKRTWILAR